MTTETLPELDGRHQLFEAARHSADWTVHQLWISYLTLGGQIPIVDLKGYLGGSAPMPSGQQDVLACALNERLTDLFEEDRVPYLTELPDRCEALNMLEDAPATLPRPHNQGSNSPFATLTQQKAELARPTDQRGLRPELIFERI